VKNLLYPALVLLAVLSPGARGAAHGEGGDAPGLPVKRIALFSSGVGYFEHAGAVSGNAELFLSFDLEAVDDALKSLTINDPAPGTVFPPGGGASPSVSYPSEETLEQTLKSLGVDLSGSPGAAAILAAQRGADLEVSAPNPISGRILGVEYRRAAPEDWERPPAGEAFLSLYTGGGIRIIAVKDIVSFRFTDPALNAGISRALDLIAAHRGSKTRRLRISLPGGGNRNVSLSYVIAAPVWKVSYRLDLGQAKPLFQGWAIIDNDSDADWNNVELSLVSGRPVSFIQRLYPPYYLDRPALPLAIAGAAQARGHDPGYARDERSPALREEAYLMDAEAPEYNARAAKAMAAPAEPRPAPPRSSLTGVPAAAAGSAAGDQFAYTVKNPVTLPRRQSAMIPLGGGTMGAVKTLILPGARALGTSIHPELAAELTNTTGMKLPAGPITVFDGGGYAGDALIEFFGENDKRLISYGEDLSVTAQAALALSREISAVTISAGVMTIRRRQVQERTYTVKNAAAEAKRIIIEHPILGGANLTEPKHYLEKTASLYRFAQNLPAGGELSLQVREETPLEERIVLAQLRLDSVAAYGANQEIPPPVRAALARAAELRQKTETAKRVLADLESRRTRLYADQERIRNNLSAAGSSSDAGREYLRRMTALDGEIETLNGEIDAAGVQVRDAQKAAEDYIASLML
jgi:hypothetical protein